MFEFQLKTGVQVFVKNARMVEDKEQVWFLEGPAVQAVNNQLYHWPIDWAKIGNDRLIAIAEIKDEVARKDIGLKKILNLIEKGPENAPLDKHEKKK